MTREVQQLRAEMHEEFQRRKCPKARAAFQGSEPLARTLNHWAAVQDTAMRRLDSVEQAVLTKMDSNFRRNMLWVGLLYLAMLGNIIKDFLR